MTNPTVAKIFSWLQSIVRGFNTFRGWFLGIVFLIAGLGQFREQQWFGLAMLLLGIWNLPPSRRLLEQYIPYLDHRPVQAVISILLYGLLIAAINQIYTQ